MSTASERLSAIKHEVPTSVDELASTHAVNRTLAELPMAPIPFHAIMGRDGDSPSNGIVPHASSRLPGAESERIFPGDYGVHTSPLAIAEVKHILRKEAAGR